MDPGKQQKKSCNSEFTKCQEMCSPEKRADESLQNDADFK